MAPDFSRLIWKLENGNPLDERDRTYLATLVRAQIKKPAHRPASKPGERLPIAMTVLRYEQEHDCCREAAIAEAARVHGCSRNTVFRAIRELRQLPTAKMICNVAGVTERYEFTDEAGWQKVG
jgi:hypothetical protein